jgi:hypothetical protein
MGDMTNNGDPNNRTAQREMDYYRLLAQKAIDACPRNRIQSVCVDGYGVGVSPSHSESDFVTDLAAFFLAAANAGYIKVRVHG